LKNAAGNQSNDEPPVASNGVSKMTIEDEARKAESRLADLANHSLEIREVHKLSQSLMSIAMRVEHQLHDLESRIAKLERDKPDIQVGQIR
jgi:hypothetical protein